MNVWVYGGTSAIGGAVVDHYRKAGHVVAAMNRDFSYVPDAEVPNHVDALIVSVGTTFDGKVCSLSEEGWGRGIEGNLTSVFKALNRLLPGVVPGGSVVVLGSIVGSTGGYGCGAYAAAKAGLVGLVRAAANENAARGVCVNLLELGYVDAGMGARLNPRVKEKVLPTIPLRRFARLDEVVDAVDFLARCKYMTGGILTMAGGLR